ncbi:response regulator [Novispirillum sp. DQ9]|uniref:hybrid sensor histidine kinase/response regulator n=1 Tax=Novispirillum sp. DQ9 TaxID=3398612 RepID=UPI003C7B0D1D
MSAPPVQAEGRRRPVRFGVASRVTLGLLALVSLTIVVATVSLVGIERLGDAFDHIALERHRQLTSVARLAQRAEAVAVTAPRMITVQARFDLQRQEQYLNDQLGLIKAAFEQARALGVDPAIIADMEGHREAMLANLGHVSEVVNQRITIAEAVAAHLRALDKAFAASRPLREAAEDGSPELRRSLDLIDEAHATVLQSLSLPFASAVRNNERRAAETLSHAFALLQRASGEEYDTLIALWHALKDGADGPDGLLALRRRQLDVESTIQGLLIRNNVLSARFSSSATNLFTDMEADIERDRQAFSDMMDLGVALLAGAVGASVLGALLVFLFLRRRVIARLTGLQQTMHARAEGNPVPIPTAGNDEISDMARSLAFFVTEIERARDEATLANDAKSSFLANMSHEIRTPMNAVIGLSRLALQTPLNDRQRDYLTKILGASQALLGIINDILDFSKIEAGKLDLEEAEFSATDVLDDVAALITGKAEEKGLEIVFSASPDLPQRLYGDSLRLGQVLTNLVTNAVKFTEVGEVVVRATVESEKDDRVVVHFSVRDTGIGLSPEQAAKLFTPFTQADASTTRRFGGTGLGLSICQRLIGMMGGRIWVESAPDKGSTFHFTCNLRRATPALRDVARWKDLRGTRVLVVDDNATARAILAEMLRSFDCAVAEAADGAAALEELERAQAAGEEPYQVVLMDWRMPRMDGLEASRRIKGRDGTVDLPVIIMVTAYGRDEVIREAETRQAIDGLLIKPVNPSLLFDSMMQLIGLGTDGDERRSVLASLPTTGDATAALAGRRVLLVEDNVLNQQVASEILSHWNMAVEVANDGREALLALETAGAQGYDVVLMDVQMPVMDGIEATRAIRAQSRFDTLPVIAMTAHALQEERERCLDAGMDEHVSKPIDPEHLCAVLARILGPLPRAAATAPADGGTGAAAAAAAPADSPLPDALPGVDVAAALRRVMGNARLLAKLLRDFRQQHRDSAAHLATLMTAGDWSAAREEAHALKGVAGNVGAMEVHAAAQALEKAIKVERLAEAETALAPLTAALTVVVEGLAVLEEPLPPAPAPAAPAAGTAPDRAALVAELDRLRGMLESFDLEAAEAARRVQDLVDPALAPLAGRLADAAAGLDFDAAGTALADLRAALGLVEDAPTP